MLSSVNMTLYLATITGYGPMSNGAAEMSTRLDVLKQLVHLQGDIEGVIAELSLHGWDCDHDLYTITKEAVARVLVMCLNGVIDISTLIAWADAIECREDLGYTDDVLYEMICKLACPEIYGQVTESTVQRMIELIR